MNEREMWLLFWSSVAGLFGWLTWELKNEKDKADEQRENYVRRCIRQHGEHQNFDNQHR